MRGTRLLTPPFPSDVALCLSLPSQDLTTPDFAFPSSPTPVGLEALEHLQRAAFGPDSLSLSFMAAAHGATLSMAEAGRDLCAAALLDATCESNCLSLLSLASAVGCPRLARRARRVALARFAHAPCADYCGLVGLSRPLLVGLLADDRLSVASEADAFRALVAWTEADRGAPAGAGAGAARGPGAPGAPGAPAAAPPSAASTPPTPLVETPSPSPRGGATSSPSAIPPSPTSPSRAAQLAQNIAACVRLGRMDASELEFVESHPLVSSSRLALALVAAAFLGRITGAACAEPFGLATVARPRTGMGRRRASGRPCAKKAALGAGRRAPAGAAASDGRPLGGDAPLRISTKPMDVEARAPDAPRPARRLSLHGPASPTGAPSLASSASSSLSVRLSHAAAGRAEPLPGSPRAPEARTPRGAAAAAPRPMAHAAVERSAQLAHPAPAPAHPRTLFPAASTASAASASTALARAASLIPHPPSDLSAELSGASSDWHAYREGNDSLPVSRRTTGDSLTSGAPSAEAAAGAGRVPRTGSVFAGLAGVATALGALDVDSPTIAAGSARSRSPFADFGAATSPSAASAPTGAGAAAGAAGPATPTAAGLGPQAQASGPAASGSLSAVSPFTAALAAASPLRFSPALEISTRARTAAPSRIPRAPARVDPLSLSALSVLTVDDPLSARGSSREASPASSSVSSGARDSLDSTPSSSDVEEVVGPTADSVARRRRSALEAAVARLSAARGARAGVNGVAAAAAGLDMTHSPGPRGGLGLRPGELASPSRAADGPLGALDATRSPSRARAARRARASSGEAASGPAARSRRALFGKGARSLDVSTASLCPAVRKSPPALDLPSAGDAAARASGAAPGMGEVSREMLISPTRRTVAAMLGSLPEGRAAASRRRLSFA